MRSAVQHAGTRKVVEPEQGGCRVNVPQKEIRAPKNVWFRNQRIGAMWKWYDEENVLMPYGSMRNV